MSESASEPIAKRLRSSTGSSRSSGGVPSSDVHASPPLLPPSLPASGLTPRWLTPTAWNKWTQLKQLSQELYGLTEEEHDALKQTHPEMWHQTFRVASRHRAHQEAGNVDRRSDLIEPKFQGKPPAEIDEMRRVLHDQGAQLELDLEPPCCTLT